MFCLIIIGLKVEGDFVRLMKLALGHRGELDYPPCASDLRLDAYRLWLVEAYDIKKSNIFDQFVFENRLFADLESALDAAHAKRAKSLIVNSGRNKRLKLTLISISTLSVAAVAVSIFHASTLEKRQTAWAAVHRSEERETGILADIASQKERVDEAERSMRKPDAYFASPLNNAPTPVVAKATRAMWEKSRNDWVETLRKYEKDLAVQKAETQAKEDRAWSLGPDTQLDELDRTNRYKKYTIFFVLVLNIFIGIQLLALRDRSKTLR